MDWKRIFTLIKKDILLEWRQPYQSLSMVLYLVSTVYVIYLVFNAIIRPDVWVALFWISYLFGAMIISSRSFQRESGGRYFFFYTLCSPAELMVAKLIFNGLIFFLLAMLNWALYALFLGSPVYNSFLFFGLCLLAGLSFSGVLTLINGISVKVKNHPALSAILGFPLMLPVILVLLAGSGHAMVGVEWSETQPYFIALLGLTVTASLLSIILFPFLWKE
jgi:heme exporter protein B